jgi:exopolysaccharide biosynthesis protein
MLTPEQQNIVDHQVSNLMKQGLSWDSAVLAVGRHYHPHNDNHVTGFYMEQKALWEGRKEDYEQQRRAENERMLNINGPLYLNDTRAYMS